MKKLFLFRFSSLLAALLSVCAFASCAGLDDDGDFQDMFVTCPGPDYAILPIYIKTPMPDASLWQHPFEVAHVLRSDAGRASIMAYTKKDLPLPEFTSWYVELDCTNLFEAQEGEVIEIVKSSFDCMISSSLGDYSSLGKEGRVAVMENRADSICLLFEELKYDFPSSSMVPKGEYRIGGKLTLKQN